MGTDETGQTTACCCETAGTAPTCQVMKIAIASDHAGFTYKEQIKVLLRSLGHQVRDFGTSLDTARWSREHNDANVLAIGQRTIPAELALEIVRVWMTMAFAGGRHAARVNSIER